MNWLQLRLVSDSDDDCGVSQSHRLESLMVKTFSTGNCGNRERSSEWLEAAS
jgi:hypothetical protein